MHLHARLRGFKVSGSKIPSLINGSAGCPAAAEAGKRCECKGCGASIVMGEKCYDIPNPRESFSNSRRFCTACFKKVIEKTKADLVALETL
jgi:hypothetical protein